MKCSLALLVLLATSVVACARESAHAPASGAAPGRPASATAPSPAAAAANALAPAPEKPPSDASLNAAAPDQEADDQEDQPATASLERLAALPAQQQLPDARWKVGVNYDPIVPAQPTEVPAGKVEVLEVFWYACPHCYAIEPYVQGWRKAKADYIEFVRVPIMWGPVHRAHARLYYTLEALGRADLHDKVFDTIHLQNNLLVAQSDEQTLELQLAFAKAHGIDAEKFKQAYNSLGVTTKLQRAEELGRRYQVTGVPFFAVNGKYTSDIDKAGGSENLFVLISDLAANEHRH